MQAWTYVVIIETECWVQVSDFCKEVAKIGGNVKNVDGSARLTKESFVLAYESSIFEKVKCDEYSHVVTSNKGSFQ